MVGDTKTASGGPRRHKSNTRRLATSSLPIITSLANVLIFPLRERQQALFRIGSRACGSSRTRFRSPATKPNPARADARFPLRAHLVLSDCAPFPNPAAASGLSGACIPVPVLSDVPAVSPASTFERRSPRSGKNRGAGGGGQEKLAPSRKLRLDFRKSLRAGLVDKDPMAARGQPPSLYKSSETRSRLDDCEPLPPSRRNLDNGCFRLTPITGAATTGGRCRTKDQARSGCLEGLGAGRLEFSNPQKLEPAIARAKGEATAAA
jgi:hypothetical protein